ncbi:uncharacterized protein PgNI_09788 [Pyricularia grisea]|uniref:Rhodopsin domain-containing protein n=1 Tax=Pyricularia grisea TaxID=148305 RepID=A0A6P8AT62_PYRGI|nr:uncharacterized protein PgNI_09788 [Pyricularia grisea]TLD05298.1 hypothetical protein PgNI_09788 [Pyricularia grisea]
MAFAIYFMRVFPQRIHKQVNMVMLVFLLMQGITESVVSQVMCVPRAKLFLPESPGKCLDTLKFYYASRISAMAIVRSATPRPAAGDVERNGGRSGSLGVQLRRAFNRAKIKTGQGSWYGSRSGVSSGTGRRTRFGVTSSVSTGQQSRNHQPTTDETGQSRVQSLAVEESGPRPDSPDHGGILVTHDIEVGIETDEDYVSGTDVSDVERNAPEDERNLTDSSSIVDQDSRWTDTTNDSNEVEGEQLALERSE